MQGAGVRCVPQGEVQVEALQGGVPQVAPVVRLPQQARRRRRQWQLPQRQRLQEALLQRPGPICRQCLALLRATSFCPLPIIVLLAHSTTKLRR